MSDCRNGGRSAYAVPKPVERATLRRLASMNGEPPWELVVPDWDVLPDEATQFVDVLVWRGVRFARVKECSPTIEPWECNKAKFDAYCGNCGCEIGDELMRLSNYCPHCGARVKEGGDD